MSRRHTQGGEEVYLHTFFNLDATWWWVLSATLRLLYARDTDTVPPIVQEAGWPPASNCTGANNLVPAGIQTSDRPARSK
jgi:hypothetical protein